MFCSGYPDQNTNPIYYEIFPFKDQNFEMHFLRTNHVSVDSKFTFLTFWYVDGASFRQQYSLLEPAAHHGRTNQDSRQPAIFYVSLISTKHLIVAIYYICSSSCLRTQYSWQAK